MELMRCYERKSLAYLTVCVLAAFIFPGCNENAGIDPDYKLLSSGSFIQDKNYYLLTVFQKDARVKSCIENDETLAAISAGQESLFRSAADTCAGDIGCCASALLYPDDKISQVSGELNRVFSKQVASRALIEKHMRPSGMFQLHASETNGMLLEDSWLDTMNGLQAAFDSYVRSLPVETLDKIMKEVDAASPEGMLFFEPLLKVCIAAMIEQGRDESARYEPLASGQNKKALERMASIKWDDYEYPLLIVPGYGPEKNSVVLSPTGKIRCQAAAKRYHAGLAPFILTSGGHVHPDRTPYCEALEMKKYLINELDVPENAILVDPHARHTTTNLRNAARIMFRNKIPTERYSLIITDLFQSFYIAYMLDKRCLEELGYMPYLTVRMISLCETLFLPDMKSLHADPRDPLDP